MPRATEIEWFEKDMGGAVAKWMLELVDHQPIAVDTQPLEGDGPSAIYTMVKTNTFNGIPLPSIAIWSSSRGELRSIRKFGYENFLHRLS